MMARKLTILYGSQTGTAQDLAEYVWRESKRFYFTGTVMPMDKYNIQLLPNEEFVVFVSSTTGQGDVPDNMKSFWRFLLRKSLPSDSLSSVHCAVLGLGDSGYEKFNFVGKRLNKRLQQLGASILIPIGLCDDQHDLGPSAVYVKWLNDLWNELLIHAPLPDGLTALTESPRQFRWNVDVVTSSRTIDSHQNENIYHSHRDSIFDETTFTTAVIDNKRTTADHHFQDVRLISFNSDNLHWQPGDVLVVRPQNSDAQVDELFEIFKEYDFDFGPNTIIKLSEIDAEMPVPDYLNIPLPLKTIAKQLWDLNAVPRQRTFKLLALNCDDELEKEKLLEFSSSEGQDDLFTYANRPRRTILEVLRDFHKAAAKLNLRMLFEVFQFIKMRSFSIASCPEHGTLDLLVAVVQYKTMMATPRLGLCSNWLKQLKCGDEIQAVIKKGTFKIPTDLTTPIVMVGPGTGLAPFRSLLLQRRHQLKNRISSQPFPFTLFFGCRGEKLDFHCKEDLLKMEEEKLLKLFTAFSRDQDDKIYVQHRISEQSEWLREKIIHQNGFFLLAGNAKNMPAAVKKAFSDALNDPDYVQTIISSGRYQEETWA
ncbi:NADPH-dependent diflavin oxidoreductase 1 [Sitodiplosis mosellana]|uniref:NADPH-dependent diflavin oxidoreductase 1 n=1 Tax=Sitodiplosis mosellana TaxID=263140 RepID=UPI00244420BE|nr:NADPH-dependent diflavin oxidoreductase 1 [Sitodiplosis mosellana]